MNEEFKKKYLKYKIKYLELIGGETAQEKNETLTKNKYLDTIALLNFLSELKNEDLEDPYKEYNKVFSTNRIIFFGDDDGKLNIAIEKYKEFLDLFKIKNLYINQPEVDTAEADLKKLEKITKLTGNVGFPVLRKIIKEYKHGNKLKSEDILYILNRIYELIVKYSQESIKSRFIKLLKNVNLPEKKIDSILNHIYDDIEIEPVTGTTGLVLALTLGDTTSLEATKKPQIYSIFNILRDKKNLEEIKKALKNDKYKEIYTTDLVEEIAAAIGSDFTESYGINNNNEINNIKEYIKKNHIDKIFKGDQLYKLFIFIVVEFGKLLNCESASEMKTMNKLLYPPL
tara:strand:- start:43 stop:1068 length:1026 start_codon:yes stop_codon:yes gene_type:complete